MSDQFTPQTPQTPAQNRVQPEPPTPPQEVPVQPTTSTPPQKPHRPERIDSYNQAVFTKASHRKRRRMVIILLVLVLVLVLGGLGYYYYTERSTQSDHQQTSPTPQNEQQTLPPVSDQPVSNAFVIPDSYAVYTDTADGVTFRYPAEWGDVEQETVTGFRDTNYTDTLEHYVAYTFSEQPTVQLRAMTGRAFEGGRGFETPEMAATVFASAIQSYAYRQDNLSGTVAIYRSDFNDPTQELRTELTDPQYAVIEAPEQAAGTILITTNFTLANLGYADWTAEYTEMYGSQAQNEAAIVKTNKQSFYVRNFTTGTILGLNANYNWGDTTYDQAIDKGLAIAIGSFQSIQ